MSQLLQIITAQDLEMRNRSPDAFCRCASFDELRSECAALDAFRQRSENLYERVRALFFLYAIYRFHLPQKPELKSGGLIPFEGCDNLLKRRFEEAIDLFLAAPLSDATASALAEVFDFAKDYLGLLKAAVIASGIVPPGVKGSGQSLADLLGQMIRPGYSIELVSQVNGIPKGSRLAVSTTLLASLIAVCMRATGQAQSLTGPLSEEERRVVAARAILGEWLGGSSGWQDSGGIWPGIKLIEGVEAGEEDPESGISRGRLLPRHTILGPDVVTPETRRRLQESLVLVHGGMAQDVGPILEMVTEKYLLRSEAEWEGRQEAMRIFDQLTELLRCGDIRRIGQNTERNFCGPIQTIIPWASNLYTETLIERARSTFGEDFWGFWMLGGMAGGGMGFLFVPQRKAEAQVWLKKTMGTVKCNLERAVPFAMEPVVYNFAINERGTWAELRTGEQALMPPDYYMLTAPALIRYEQRSLSPFCRAEMEAFGAAARTQPKLAGMIQALFDQLLPPRKQSDDPRQSLTALLEANGFDRIQHEQIHADLRSGRVGLAQNRLPVRTVIEDVTADDVSDVAHLFEQERTRLRKMGLEALAAGAVAVVTLAGGAGGRWTKGAGVVKALNPFARIGGKHRNFIEVHLAKSRCVSRLTGTALAHVVTTSYLTHEPIAEFLRRKQNYGYAGPLHLSPGRAVGLRLVPMARDLRFAWEETPQQLLDEQAQKVRESLHAALIQWVQQMGEGSDYTDNALLQCLHPVGHWYEIPNLLRNGVLVRMLEERPQLRWLMVHNIDTLGADVDPMLLGWHIDRGATMTAEVITRRIDDRGGGLARVDGRLRLIEGLAMLREEIEFNLTYYSSATYWIDLDQLLGVFGLTRSDLTDAEKVATAVRNVAARMPTYVTLKDVKKRWGKGQEDVYPVTQFEKLWGDMTTLPGLNCAFVAVPRLRSQQLKEVAQLDGWLRDGSAAYLETLCEWK